MNDIDVKNLRKKMQMTQSQLAMECGVTLRTVQNWEKGETIPESKQKLLDNIVKNYNSQTVTGNTNNIKSNNINSDDAIKLLTTLFENQLKVKDEQMKAKDEQIGRLLAILEKREVQ